MTDLGGQDSKTHFMPSYHMGSQNVRPHLPLEVLFLFPYKRANYSLFHLQGQCSSFPLSFEKVR